MMNLLWKSPEMPNTKPHPICAMGKICNVIQFLVESVSKVNKRVFLQKCLVHQVLTVKSSLLNWAAVDYKFITHCACSDKVNLPMGFNSTNEFWEWVSVSTGQYMYICFSVCDLVRVPVLCDVMRQSEFFFFMFEVVLCEHHFVDACGCVYVCMLNAAKIMYYAPLICIPFKSLN